MGQVVIKKEQKKEQEGAGLSSKGQKGRGSKKKEQEGRGRSKKEHDGPGMGSRPEMDRTEQEVAGRKEGRKEGTGREEQ